MLAMPYALILGSLATDESPTAWTDCGLVLGTTDPAMGGFVYHGVPYAMPPTGTRRWKRSELLKEGGGCWTGVFNARSEAPPCAQNPKTTASGTVTWDGVEDCLTLDIWGPSRNRSERKPVLVHIHGGSLVSGSPFPLYAFQDEPLIQIGVRYRLNLFGFLALRELSTNDLLGASGNYGFSDQITALRWAQRNVEAFGGNPDRVTLIGCSSGGTSIWNLLAAPLAKGLFHAAIPLSSASRNNVTLAQAEHDNRGFVDRTCGETADRYSCIMRLSCEKIMEGFLYMSSSFPFLEHPDFELPSPSEYQSGVCIVDGVIIPTPLHEALRTPGAHADVIITLWGGWIIGFHSSAICSPYPQIIHLHLTNLGLALGPTT